MPTEKLSATPAGRQLVAALRKTCAGLPEVEDGVDGFGHTTFRVRRRSFVIAGMGQDGLTVSIKADLPNQALLTRRGPYYRTPYIGQHGWISIDDPGDEEWPEVEALIHDGWRLAAPKSLAKQVPPA
jgi:predicted DNA-binding protein (MmcQ/YjbR family)